MPDPWSGGAGAVELEALVEIAGDRLHQHVDLAVEEMVRAGNDFLIDHDSLLGLELLDQRGHVLGRDHRVLVAVHDHPGGRAGREKGEIVEIRGRRDRDEAFDLGPAHEKLHADPGAEREAGDPAAARFGIDRLRPVERRGGIREFALAVVEGALAAPHAAEVEAQHREIAVYEGVVHLIDDLVVHRPAELRVRVQDDGERRVLLPRRVVSSLDAPGRADENDFRHGLNLGRWTRAAGEAGRPSTARLTAWAGARNYLEPF